MFVDIWHILSAKDMWHKLPAKSTQTLSNNIINMIIFLSKMIQDIIIVFKIATKSRNIVCFHRDQIFFKK